jgi:hypothetical protein
MVRMLDLTSSRARSGTGPGDAAAKAYAIKSASSNVEALAGAGDLAHARELIAKVLAIDSSDATKATLRDALGRAKHPELLAGAPATP